VLRGHVCSSPDATLRAARALGVLLEPGDAIGLVGDLGAGKTLLVQGLARGLRVPEQVRVTSPTFTIANLVRGGRLVLHHVDLYRIERASELRELGLDELAASGGVIAIEWCDRFPVLPADHLRIVLGVAGEDARSLDAEGRGPRSTALAAAWAASLGYI
jgi:tRNA threonylcarbamoyladenosine biosynthesis protein TsaE